MVSGTGADCRGIDIITELALPSFVRTLVCQPISTHNVLIILPSHLHGQKLNHTIRARRAGAERAGVS